MLTKKGTLAYNVVTKIVRIFWIVCSWYDRWNENTAQNSCDIHCIIFKLFESKVFKVEIGIEMSLLNDFCV